MTAKEYLRSIRALDAEADAIRSAIQTAKSKLEGLGSPALSDMPKGGQQETLADGIAKLVDLQRDWEHTIGDYAERKRLATRQIAELEDERHRVVLYNYYVAGLTFEKIAVTTNKDYTTICRWHGNALQSFTKKHLTFLEMP